MLKFLIALGLAFSILHSPFSIPQTHAAYSPLTFRYQHHLFTLDPDLFPEWRTPQEQWFYEGKPIAPIAKFRVDGDTVPPLPLGLTRASVSGWNRSAIRATLSSRINDRFKRQPGDVKIRRGTGGAIIFEGVGLTGRQVDLEVVTNLTLEALEKGMTDIALSVIETQPTIDVLDPELAAMGIKEVVTVGESDFSGSPINRRHNIATGLSKFNGHLIKQGETFSFGETLGPVNGKTGYKLELVIKGDRTEPDYGGGLCQISTTAYRGVWEYGFPIKQRINHSYSVQYYFPQGTDATVYPPNPDMKFTNDSPGALLMQTHQENDHAYFIYYGTRDTRKAQVLGPFIWGSQAPPPDRTVYTTALPPGTKRKLGERHAGLKAAWYRMRTSATGGTLLEPVYSTYQARPLFYEVGVETLPEPGQPVCTDPTVPCDPIPVPVD